MNAAGCWLLFLDLGSKIKVLECGYIEIDGISKTVLCSNILLLDLSGIYECAYIIWILIGSMKIGYLS